jgi:hypothetical protein
MPKDKQLDKLLLESNTSMKEYRAMYYRTYQQIRDGRNIRYSGKEYTNTPERLKAIKEKYANGVTLQHIKEMVDNL